MGNIDVLLDMYIPIKYQLIIRRWWCPQCGGEQELVDTEFRGLKCKFCGWHESGGAYPKFIPRTPENTPL